jgi:hypothetical protein
MGIFNKSKEAAEVMESAGSLASKIGEAFDKNFTNQEEKLEARNKMIEIVTELMSQLDNLRQQVIMAEANGNWLQRSWRPLIMLTFAGIIVCTWILFPIINIFVKSPELSTMITELREAERFWNVVELGLGGYVIGRSVEKIADSVGKNMDISIGKKK